MIKAAVAYRYVEQGEQRTIYAFLENSVVVCKNETGNSLGSYEFSGDSLLGPGPLSLDDRNSVIAEIIRVIQPGNHIPGDPSIIADSDPQTVDA